MVDEKDEGYDSEEGEYHFSDDQVNYDVEGVTPPKKAAPVSPSTTSASASSVKDATLQKLTQHRRMVIGVVVFIVLISVVYKMMAPSSMQPPTDFAATTTSGGAAKPVTPPPSTPGVQTQPPTQLAAATQPPIPVTPPPAPVETPVAPATSVEPPSSQVMPASTPQAPAQTMMPSNNAPSMEAPQPMAQSSMPSSQPPPVQEQPTVAVQVNPQQVGAPVAAAAMPNDAVTKNVIDRLASLEQQNAALMNLLQTDYAQKMADYETQSTMTRGKLEEVTKRLNRMDAALNQISQALQSGGNGGGARSEMMDDRMPAVPTAAMKAMEPKVVYTVQAIIPGRAWLKSETGETVTVAEGDVLKNYGRVTKIDPYDGVVDIDTGNKMITLSYGTNLE